MIDFHFYIILFITLIELFHLIVPCFDILRLLHCFLLHLKEIEVALLFIWTVLHISISVSDSECLYFSSFPLLQHSILLSVFVVWVPWSDFEVLSSWLFHLWKAGSWIERMEHVRLHRLFHFNLRLTCGFEECSSS